ncbi:hypothetical protein U1Q18_030739 [Sarracenia purpurea var. burkii]
MTDHSTPIVETHWRIGSTDRQLVICGLPIMIWCRWQRILGSGRRPNPATGSKRETHPGTLACSLFSDKESQKRSVPRCSFNQTVRLRQLRPIFPANSETENPFGRGPSLGLWLCYQHLLWFGCTSFVLLPSHERTKLSASNSTSTMNSERQGFWHDAYSN